MKISDEIIIMRDKLNKSIIEGRDYEHIYKLSIQLDDLIALFYQMQMEIEQKKKVS